MGIRDTSQLRATNYIKCARSNCLSFRTEVRREIPHFNCKPSSLDNIKMIDQPADADVTLRRTQSAFPPGRSMEPPIKDQDLATRWAGNSRPMARTAYPRQSRGMNGQVSNAVAYWPRYALPRGTALNGYTIERVL